VQPVDQERAEGEPDLFALFLEGRFEELLATIDAEWDRTNPKDSP
jgi:hypothetical protein